MRSSLPTCIISGAPASIARPWGVAREPTVSHDEPRRPHRLSKTNASVQRLPGPLQVGRIRYVTCTCTADPAGCTWASTGKRWIQSRLQSWASTSHIQALSLVLSLPFPSNSLSFSLFIPTPFHLYFDISTQLTNSVLPAVTRELLRSRTFATLASTTYCFPTPAHILRPSRLPRSSLSVSFSFPHTQTRTYISRFATIPQSPTFIVLPSYSFVCQVYCRLSSRPTVCAHPANCPGRILKTGPCQESQGRHAAAPSKSTSTLGHLRHTLHKESIHILTAPIASATSLSRT